MHHFLFDYEEALLSTVYIPPRCLHEREKEREEEGERKREGERERERKKESGRGKEIDR